MESADAPETSVHIYQNALRYLWEGDTVLHTKTHYLK